MILISTHFCAVLFLFCQIASIIAGQPESSAAPALCKVPSQRPELNECVLAFECPAYEALKTNFTVGRVSFLKRIQCAEPGKVCCPLSDGPYQHPSIAVDASHVKVRPSYAATPEHRIGAGDDDVMVAEDEECGVATDRRIIGGEIAGLEDFPWTALLVYNTTSKYGCSGAVINKRYILTAAHCVAEELQEKNGRLTAVRLGEYDTQGDPDCIQEESGFDCADRAIDYAVEKIIVHPYYNASGRDKHDDIALIRTRKTITYSTFIQPICLPSKKLDAGIEPGQMMTLSGWGVTDKFQSRFGIIHSPIKLYAEVPVVNQTGCAALFKTLNLNLGPGQLCAGGHRNRDSCPGDSGGPLMYFNHRANRYVCAGIVSLGKGGRGKMSCGFEGYPGVYTRTDRYVDWIENALRHNN